MTFVPAICTQCGARIKVDNSRDAGICEHCGTAFVTEKVINNYNTTVIVQGESEDDLLQRGIAQLEMKEYNSAKDTFETMTEKYPRNYKGWLGSGILWAIAPGSGNYDDGMQRLRNNVLVNCPDSIS